jgi:hypothetical protein
MIYFVDYIHITHFMIPDYAGHNITLSLGIAFSSSFFPQRKNDLVDRLEGSGGVANLVQDGGDGAVHADLEVSGVCGTRSKKSQ